MYENMKRILFDEKSSRMIALKNENGEEVRFLQVYATVLEDEIYCILSPAVVIDNVKNKTGLVFKLISTGELVYENDENIASRIFGKYYTDLNTRRENA